jgi:hypothetical protein
MEKNPCPCNVRHTTYQAVEKVVLKSKVNRDSVKTLSAMGITTGLDTLAEIAAREPEEVH